MTKDPGTGECSQVMPFSIACPVSNSPEVFQRDCWENLPGLFIWELVGEPNQLPVSSPSHSWQSWPPVHPLSVSVCLPTLHTSHIHRLLPQFRPLSLPTAIQNVPVGSRKQSCMSAEFKECGPSCPRSNITLFTHKDKPLNLSKT